MKKNFSKNATVAVFLLTIFGFSIVNILTPSQDFSYEENRPLAPFPEVSIKNVFSGNFDDAFESYFQDHFFNRKGFIESKSYAKRATLFLENNDVYYGKNDTLIRTFQTYQDKVVNNNIDYINEFIEETSLNTAIMLVPTATWCNTVDLSKGTYSINQDELGKEIKGKFKNCTYLPSLTQSSDAENYYFKTDHHWNQNGAYLGYESICKNFLKKQPEEFTTTKVSEGFEGTMYSRSGAFWVNGDPIYRIDPTYPISISLTVDDQDNYTSIYFDERLQEKDKYMYYLDGNHPHVHIETTAPSNKRAIIVKDSYAHILMPYLISEYSVIDMVDLRYYRQPVSDLITDQEDTDLLFIYSLDNFCEDSNLAFLR